MRQSAERYSLDTERHAGDLLLPNLPRWKRETNGQRGTFTAPRLCERETLMDELHKLIQKKKYEGVLSERDALVFWRHVEARIDGSSSRWTQRDFEQLTRWQLGLPTTMQFQIVAGPMGAHAPKRLDVSPERRTLLRRKYGTFAERQAARKAKEAARQASLRLKKMA
jgi:hypothetical protein